MLVVLNLEWWQPGRNRCIDFRAWPHFRVFRNNAPRTLNTGGEKKQRHYTYN